MLVILDIVTGMVFFFLLLSLLCTSVNELISNLLRLRARTLFKEIERIVDDPAVRSHFWNSGLIRAYCRDCETVTGKEAPSYLTGGIFAAALLSAVGKVNPDRETETAAPLSASVREGHVLKDVLVELETSATESATELKAGLSDWFNSVMERSTGVYRRKLQRISFLVALVIASAANADSFAVGKALWHDPSLRVQVAEAAQAYSEANQDMLNEESAGEAAPAADVSIGADSEKTITDPLDTFDMRLEAINDELHRFPLGWDLEDSLTFWSVLISILGILVTAIAMTLGAPFWFDALQRIMNLRSTGPRVKIDSANPLETE